MATRVFTKTVLAEKLLNELKDILGDFILSIETESTTVTVTLESEPTGQQDDDLTQAVNSHVPTYKKYKVWDYVQDAKPGHIAPLDVDYKSNLIVRLHPKKTFVQGERVKVEYYKDASAQLDGSITFSDLVLEENYVFTRDVAGFASSREQTINWYLEDDSKGDAEKVTMKYYAGIDKLQEGTHRRQNLIDILIMDVSNMMLYNQTVVRATEESNPSYELTLVEISEQIILGRDFLSLYSDEFDDFVKHSSKEVLDLIEDDVATSFLSDNVPGTATSIRDYIISEMTI